MAIPLFIFAATVCRFINSRASSPETQLTKFLQYRTTSRLDATYRPVLDQLLVDVDPSDKEDVIKGFREVVGSIILLATPLSTLSLSSLLGIQKDDIDSRLRLLHSVLSVPSETDSPVRMFHLSFRDFLVDLANSTTNEFWVDEKKCHERLAKRCLELLSSGYLKEDICNQKMPGKARIEVDPQTIDICLPAPVRYACLYWVYHLTESKEKIQDKDHIHHFLKHHFLHWLEALSLLGKISENIGMIDNLLALVDVTIGKEISAFLGDAKRFILSYRSIADLAPLQLYSSALIFTPKASILRNIFHNTIPRWIQQEPRVESGWNAVQQTLEGHSSGVRSIAFSHDSKLLASASDDNTVKIWDTSTGSCQQTLEGHSDVVWSVAFSHNSKLLASSSGDKIVKIWDTSTGSLRQTVEVKDHISNLSFNRADSSLITNVGCIRVDRSGRTVLSDPSREGSSNRNCEGLGISGSWITWNAQNLLWMPPDFRVGAHDISPLMSTVAGGCSSGRVFLIRFSLVVLMGTVSFNVYLL